MPGDVTSHPKGNTAKMAGLGFHYYQPQGLCGLGFKSQDSVFRSF